MYEIYCMYHKSVNRSWYGNQLNAPLFTRIGTCPDADLQLPRVFDVPSLPTYKCMGRQFAEFELFLNMLWAHRAGHLELPEYVGFTQHDMKWDHWQVTIKDFMDEMPMRPDRCIGFQPYSASYIVNQSPRFNRLFKDALTFFETPPAYENMPLAMCDAIVVHRAVFLDLCERIEQICADPIMETYTINNAARERDHGSMLERFVALWILDQKLEMRWHPVQHYFNGGR